VHSLLYPLAVRLLLGEEIHLVDEHGRRWVATAEALSYGGAAVVEGDAYEVAREVVRRGMRA